MISPLDPDLPTPGAEKTKLYGIVVSGKQGHNLHQVRGQIWFTRVPPGFGRFRRGTVRRFGCWTVPPESSRCGRSGPASCAVLGSGVRSGMFNLYLSRPIGLIPFLFPFPPQHSAPTGPAPVEARFGNYRGGPRHRISGPTGVGSLFGQREEGKDGGRGARLVSKPGSHRCKTGGEREGGEREVFRATSHGTETGMRETAKSGQNATN
jgi:hypothetical protein